MVKVAVVQASPLFPLAPFAVIPAILTLTVPLPDDGLIQSNDHARLALLACVIDLPLTFTPEFPAVDSEPLSTTTLKPPCEPDTPPDTET